MKMTCPQSIKFLKLKRRLRLPHWQAVGLLESLWLFAQMNSPRGDIGRFSNEDIAAGFEWDGDADSLVAELIACGFVDECEVNRLVVHDWSDHMPTYLKGAMAKNGLSVAKQVAKQPAKQDQEQPAKHGAKQTQIAPEQPAPSLVLSGLALSGVGLPCQSGAVVDTCTPQAASVRVEHEGRRPSKPKEHPGFVEWYAIYPRKQARQYASKAYVKALAKIDADELLQATREYADAVLGHVPDDKIPYPATWLNGERWTDDRATWRPPPPIARQPDPDPRGTFAVGAAWLAKQNALDALEAQRAMEANEYGE